MTIKRVWSAKLDGNADPPLWTLYSDAADHMSESVYLPMRRTHIPGYGGWAATNLGELPWWRLFCDRFHRPQLIYQWAIIWTGGALGLPTPARTHKGRTINGLNLLGGRMDIRLGIDRGINWPQKMQALPILQWHDETAFLGLGTTYLATFIPRGRPTLDQALGAAPARTRDPAGQFTPAIAPINYTFDFVEPEMDDMGANPVKLFQQYSVIGSGLPERQDVFAQLLNNIIIAFIIPDAGSPLPVLPNGPADGTCTPPAFQPPANPNPNIGPAIWYFMGADVYADIGPDSLNPEAIEV